MKRGSRDIRLVLGLPDNNLRNWTGGYTREKQNSSSHRRQLTYYTNI